MNIMLDFLTIVVAIVVIAKGADWVVNSAARIAQRFHVSQLIIGLTIVAFGTSAPEFAVTINATLRGFGDIAVANVIGSNIFNLGLILGLCAIINPIKTTKNLIRRDGPFLIGITILLSFFMLDLTIERLEGAFLFILLIAYIFILARSGEVSEVSGTDVKEAKWLDAILLIAGLAGVIIGAHFLVSSSINIARTFGISEWVIGVTLVAFGTSVPEMATSLAAAARRFYGISAGNLVGSDIYNLLGVLGLAGSLGTLSVDPGSRISVLILVGVVSLVVILMRTGWSISRKEGLLLVAISLARWYRALVII